ncbi:MAG: [FeFe] hydrogenase, group A [Candidatus Cloacimonetes bacterium]|nr:[FeFe] hydrogenase, group A [Candidatus Cloacimonadota bacterium]
MIKLWVDNIEVEVQEGTTILDAAKETGKKIPTLCYHKDLAPSSNCGVCVVEIEGTKGTKRACSTPAWAGMKVITNSKKLRELRKTLVEMMLADHDVVCPTCEQNNKCELQDLAYLLGVDDKRIPKVLQKKPLDLKSFSIVRDPNKCISCGRCLTVCQDIQTVHALTINGRGFEGTITTPFDKGMADSPCVNCGQCTVYCPVGALHEKSDIDNVWDQLLDKDKYVVVQEAPAIRATLGEEFGMDPEEVTVGKMYAALRRLGFDRIFDTNFSADLTIMEEGTELINRIKNGGKLPLITSCSPGWIKFSETYFPNLAENISTCKSPQQMFGTLVKTYFAEKEGIDPAKICSVSIMPCTAKKFEANRPEMRDSGYQDVDYVITTREFIKMIKEAGIDFKNLPEEKADDIMGKYTGAATIFGATGGVMEAAVRTAVAILSGEEMADVNITALRGMEGIKEASLTIPLKEGGELPVNVAVVHGLGNARKLMEKVESGEKQYHFIEVMACPGGCVGGGGQPYNSTIADRARRGQSLYKEDAKLTLRCSHHNDEVIKCYEDFLDAPNSHKAHKLLHTNYFERCKITGDTIKETTSKH